MRQDILLNNENAARRKDMLRSLLKAVEFSNHDALLIGAAADYVETESLHEELEALVHRVYMMYEKAFDPSYEDDGPVYKHGTFVRKAIFFKMAALIKVRNELKTRN